MDAAHVVVLICACGRVPAREVGHVDPVRQRRLARVADGIHAHIAPVLEHEVANAVRLDLIPAQTIVAELSARAERRVVDGLQRHERSSSSRHCRLLFDVARCVEPTHLVLVHAVEVVTRAPAHGVEGVGVLCEVAAGGRRGPWNAGQRRPEPSSRARASKTPALGQVEVVPELVHDASLIAVGDFERAIADVGIVATVACTHAVVDPDDLLAGVLGGHARLVQALALRHLGEAGGTVLLAIACCLDIRRTRAVLAVGHAHIQPARFFDERERDLAV